MVRLANRLALESPHIRSAAIEVNEFPELVRAYAITGVPKTVVNDRVELLGAVPEAEFVATALGPPPEPAVESAPG